MEQKVRNDGTSKNPSLKTVLIEFEGQIASDQRNFLETIMIIISLGSQGYYHDKSKTAICMPKAKREKKTIPMSFSRQFFLWLLCPRKVGKEKGKKKKKNLLVSPPHFTPVRKSL